MASPKLPSGKFYRLLRRPFPLETKITKEFGRGLYARDSIKMGQTVLSEEPLFTSLRPKNKITDAERFSTKTDFQIAKLLVDALEVSRNSGIDLDPLEMDEMHELAGHLDAPADIGLPAQNIYDCVNSAWDQTDLNWEIFRRLYHAIMSYAQDGQIYLVKSMINHSCLANVVPRGEELIALVDIPEGEQIFTSYGPPGKWMESLNINCVAVNERSATPSRTRMMHCNCMLKYDSEESFGKERDCVMVRELKAMNILLTSVMPSKCGDTEAVWPLLHGAYRELQELRGDPVVALQSRKSWLNKWDSNDMSINF